MFSQFANDEQLLAEWESGRLESVIDGARSRATDLSRRALEELKAEEAR